MKDKDDIYMVRDITDDISNIWIGPHKVQLIDVIDECNKDLEFYKRLQEIKACEQGYWE